MPQIVLNKNVINFYQQVIKSVFFFTLAATIGNFAYITLAKQGPFSYCNFLFNMVVSWKHLKHQTAIILYQQKKYYSFSYTGGRVQYQGGGDCLILLKMQSY